VEAFFISWAFHREDFMPADAAFSLVRSNTTPTQAATSGWVKIMTTSKRGGKLKRKRKQQQSPAARPSARTDLGKLWIAPDLNRTVSGPGGNRGEHTTSSAELLKLADIALRSTRG
jgi:hypothetical protein